MRRTRFKRRSAKPPSAARAQPGLESARQYKVVELSTVDEQSLEQALNQWVSQGWQLETIQFAMRDSSKRPAMAFVLFTRPLEGGLPDLKTAAAGQTATSDPWRRLHQLAGEEPAKEESAVVHPIGRRPG